MYHGSTKKLSNIDPKPSGVLNGQARVFATPNFRDALVFIPRWDDLDLEYGSIGRHTYMMERYPKAFDLLKTSGYVHKLSPTNFKRDNRIGPDEYISTHSEPVLEIFEIKNVLRELKKTDIVFITYSQRRNMLREFLDQTKTV